MVITVPAPDWPPEGPRPINLKQDVPQVVALLELAFGEKMDRPNRQVIRQYAAATQGGLAGWLVTGQRRLAPGYVWQENGRIVGNVTLIGSRVPGRHIVANVAVHPQMRRRGIARTLMLAVLEQVRARDGHVVMLQVVRENIPAISLYQSLGFATVGSMQSWRSPVARLRELAPSSDRDLPEIRPLHRKQWRHAYQLEIASLHPDLNWPEPLPPDAYRGGLWRLLARFLAGRQVETWSLSGPQGQPVGLFRLTAEIGQPYELFVRVHPRWRGRLERPLLARAIRRLRQMSRRHVRIRHPYQDEIMNALLQEANFSQQRTLTHMRYDLSGPG